MTQGKAMLETYPVWHSGELETQGMAQQPPSAGCHGSAERHGRGSVCGGSLLPNWVVGLLEQPGSSLLQTTVLAGWLIMMVLGVPISSIQDLSPKGTQTP